MPAETRFRALRVLELDNRRVLYRLLPDPEHPRRHLRNHMIPIRNNIVRISALPRRHESIQPLRSPCPRKHEVERDRSKRHTSTIDWEWNLDLLSIFSLVQRDRKVNPILIDFRKTVILPSQNIKTPARIPSLVLQPIFRQIPGQRHLVSGQYQFRGPSLV